MCRRQVLRALMTLVILAVIGVPCLMSCSEGGTGKRDSKNTVHVEESTSQISNQQVAEDTAVVDMSASELERLSILINAMERGETVLFNTVFPEYQWDQGPIAKSSPEWINSALSDFFESELDKLQDSIPTYDQFKSSDDNAQQYRAVILDWEGRFLTRLRDLGFTVVVLDSTVDMHTGNNFTFPQLFFYDANMSRGVEDRYNELVPGFLNRFWGDDIGMVVLHRGEYTGKYHFDSKAIVYKTTRWGGGPGPHDVTDRLKSIGADLAKRLIAEDSATFVMETHLTKPVVLYLRHVHEIIPHKGAGYKPTRDYEIRVGAAYALKKRMGGALHYTSKGTDREKFQELFMYKGGFRTGQLSKVREMRVLPFFTAER